MGNRAHGVDDLAREPPQALLEALQSFPLRWTRPTIAVAMTLALPLGIRVWRWCEALDEVEHELAPIVVEARAKALRP